MKPKNKMEPTFSALVLLLLLPAFAWDRCPPGKVSFGSKSGVRLLNAGMLMENGRKIKKRTDEGRSYFGTSTCAMRASHQAELLSLNLLDSAISFTVDVSGVDCNCNKGGEEAEHG